MLQLTQNAETSNVSFIFNKWTYEKEYTQGKCYKLNTLRKHKRLIHVSFNIKDKYVIVSGVKYNIIVDYNCGYTYKKTKGNNILVSSFSGFIKFIQEASDRNNVFHHVAQGLLINLSKRNIQLIS